MNYKFLAFVICFAAFVVSVVTATDERPGVLVNWKAGEYTAIHQEERMPRFHLFRYQLLPISRELQTNLLEPGIKTLKQLLARKNEFFAHELTSIERFKHPWSGTNLTHSFVYEKEPLYLLRLGASRSVTIKTEDFKYQPLTSWPWTHILIDNAQDSQKVAIQVYPEAFEDTTTVARILENNLNKRLEQHQLRVHFEPIFEENEFWKLVKRHEGKIRWARFNLITPNLSKISKGLADHFKDYVVATNSQESAIELRSDKSSSLVLSEDNPNTKALAAYCSEGGGNITLAVRGLKKKTVSTTETITEIEVAEFRLEDAPAAVAREIIMAVLGD